MEGYYRSAHCHRRSQKEVLRPRQQGWSLQRNTIELETLSVLEEEVLNFCVLCGNSVTVDGIKFWGHPALPPDQNSWAWSSPSFLESHRLWETVPSDVDGENIGNEEMAVCLEARIRPRLCIFGHVHSPGTVKKKHGTSFYHVAMCEDDRFGPKLAFKPTLIHLV